MRVIAARSRASAVRVGIASMNHDGGGGRRRSYPLDRALSGSAGGNATAPQLIAGAPRR
jgi:hypothetical protein